MTSTNRPIWLLDVDGVINANRPGWGAAPRRAQAYADGTGWTMRWAPALIDRIRALHTATVVEVRWATTWCEHTDQLHRVFRVGPFPAAFGARPPHKTYGELKAEAVLAALATGRPVVWTDDAEVAAGRALYLRIAQAERDGQALLIAPRPNRGLQPGDVDAIEAFAARYAPV